MTIRITDPLFLLSAQTGLSANELRAKAADANPDIDRPQEVLKIGEPIPIVFCRFRNGNGGVMLQPKMTEGSFANDITEETFSENSGASFVRAERVLRIKYLLVLSEGCLPLLQIRDIFYGGCRKGTFNQVCNGRAGSWAPGNFWDDYIDLTISPDSNGLYSINFVTDLSNGEAARAGNTIYYKDSTGTVHALNYVENNFPVFCGTSGSYSGLTTLSFEYELESEAGDANEILKNISAFVRKGLQVTRLVDGVSGESDNYVDLAKYLFQSGNRLADDLIDNTALTTAAKFADANGFLFNGQVIESQNLMDWLQTTSTNFLLRLSNSGGKFRLIPRLPYNTDHTIKTTAVTPEFTFTEEHVVNDGFEIEYISLEDREPACFVVQWRQQPETDFGLVRTVEVRYAGEAADGPFISIDMSNYCTNENHAVKAGTFRLAQRKFITHHLRLTVRERSYNSTLVVGDLVRVRLQRETSEGDIKYHDKLYEINRIDKTFASEIVYDLTHFPIDSQGRSLVARAVASASGAGNTINVGESTFTCDENSATSDGLVGTDDGGGGTPPADEDTSIEIPQPDDEDSPYPDGPNNPEDPIDESIDDDDSLGWDGSGDFPISGDNAVVDGDALPCNGRVCFYRQDKNGGPRVLKQCVTQQISGNYYSSITTADIDHYIIAVGQCLDPSDPDGYGDEIDLGQIGPVEPDTSIYSFVRWVGTKTKEVPENPSEDFTVNETTPWATTSSTIGLRGLGGCALGCTPYAGTGPSDPLSTFIGPCVFFVPYRSSVWARAGVCSGGSLALGGIQSCNCGGNGGGGGLTFGCQSTATATYKITGRWEFGNLVDGEIVSQQSWDGRPDEALDQDGNPPTGAVPGNNTFTC